MQTFASGQPNVRLAPIADIARPTILLVRTLWWQILARAFGGHSPAVLKLLASYAKGLRGGGQKRRLRKVQPPVVCQSNRLLRQGF